MALMTQLTRSGNDPSELNLIPITTGNVYVLQRIVATFCHFSVLR